MPAILMQRRYDDETGALVPFLVRGRKVRPEQRGPFVVATVHPTMVDAMKADGWTDADDQPCDDCAKGFSDDEPPTVVAQ